MHIIKIDKNNQVNGAGLRCVIWVSGCEHHCPGCHNPETWDYKIGHTWNTIDAATIAEQLASPEISGITITGGDPLSIHNREDISILCSKIKKLYPHKTIWMYTGHLFEEVVEYIKDVDVLIDGPYIAALNPGIGKLKWRGSSNQRVIDVQKSLKTNTVVEYLDFNNRTITENERSK